jgi:MoaD family protein
VEYLGYIRTSLSGNRKEEIEIRDNASITDLLKILTVKYKTPFKEVVYDPTTTQLKSNVVISVNGYLVNDIATKLNNGDHVLFLPILVGG